MIANLGRKGIQKSASTSPWAVLMLPKLASLSASIYYLYDHTNLINNLLDCYRDDGLAVFRNIFKHKQIQYKKTFWTELLNY